MTDEGKQLIRHMKEVPNATGSVLKLDETQESQDILQEFDFSEDIVNEPKAKIATFVARPVTSDESWSSRMIILTVCLIVGISVVASVVFTALGQLKPEAFQNWIQTLLAALLGFWVGKSGQGKKE